MVRVGIVGMGRIVMEWAHWSEYKKITDICKITAICDIDEKKLNEAGDKMGIPQEYRFTDYRDLIACDQVDAVDIATWNCNHCEIAEAAVAAGKPYSVEKPVGMNYTETKHLCESTEKKGLPSFICLSWRYRNYPRYMRYLVLGGKMGKIFHINVRCIKDRGLWAGRKREWRFERKKAGSGVLCDLGSHMIDVVRFLGQEFREVFASTGIFIKERPSEETGELVPVDTDDWCNITAHLESEASCTIQLSRTAATFSNLVEIEVLGETGRMLYVNLNGKDSLTFTDAKTGETEDLVPPEEFNAIQSRSFINLVNGIEDEYTAKLAQGVECQAVIDAALLSSTENRPILISSVKDGTEAVKQ